MGRCACDEVVRLGDRSESRSSRKLLRNQAKRKRVSSDFRFGEGEAGEGGGQRLRDMSALMRRSLEKVCGAGTVSAVKQLRLLDVHDACPVDEQFVVLRRLVAAGFGCGDDREPLLHVR